MSDSSGGRCATPRYRQVMHFELESAVFEGAGTDAETVARHKTNYVVTVAYGQRLEPWISAAARK